MHCARHCVKTQM
ncbi:twitching motility family protein, partial [Vibrio cholerae O1 str. EM-1676A]